MKKRHPKGETTLQMLDWLESNGEVQKTEGDFSGTCRPPNPPPCWNGTRYTLRENIS